MTITRYNKILYTCKKIKMRLKRVKYKSTKLENKN